jgi:hypothetical protein
MRLLKSKWLIGGLIAGGLASVMLLRRKGGSDYEWDDADVGGEVDTFGDRDATTPEQRWDPPKATQNVTVEEPSMAARVETSWDAIHAAWPSLTLDDVRPAEGDLDRLAGLIAEKVEQPREGVRERLEGIIS